MKYVVTTQQLSADAAITAAQAAIAKGEEIGVSINVAVTDSGGHLMAFIRADDAYLPSIKIAQDKAYTAAGFFMPSGKLYQAIKDEPDVLSGIIYQERVAAFPGGMPIYAGDNIVGAIGVSGASAEQDERCAMAGIEALHLTSSKEN